ncbi:MAG TPA: ABC transporter permease [Thermoanaerobaculia bacterium]|jgi:ABC-2 type transport system permease protein
MLRIHLLEIKYELLKLLRTPAYSLPTVLFPILFYLFFGVAMGQRQVGAVKMAAYLMATYGAFGVIGASLFGFGITVAIERGKGLLEAKRTTPMPVSAYFVAKIAMAMIFSAAVVLGLMATGILAAGVSLTFAQGARLFAVLIAGATTFSALGLAVGYFTSETSAVPIVNLIYLPMSFLAGLWVPIWFLPKPLQTLALFLPPFHLSQLALRAIGAGRPGIATSTHVLALVGATALFTALAYVGYRRDEGKRYA